MTNFGSRFCVGGVIRLCGLALGSCVLASPAWAGTLVDGATTAELRASFLLMTGIFLLLLEIKIVSQGILGFLGSALLIGAAVIIWREGTPFWGIPVGYIIPGIATVIMLTAVLAWLAYQAQAEKVSTGYQGYIGEIAEAREVIDPEGRVFFNGTYWKAACHTRIEAGQKVRVVKADRLKLMVEPLSASPAVGQDANDDGLA